MGNLYSRYTAYIRIITNLLDSYDFIDAIQIGDDVESDFGAVIFELRQKQREEMFDCAVTEREFLVRRAKNENILRGTSTI